MTDNHRQRHGLKDFMLGLIEAPVYATAIRAYSAGVKVAAVRNRKARLMIEGHEQTMSRLRNLDAGRPTVWIHSASLGEFEQARPLIEKIKDRKPDTQIVLSFFSPSGFEVRKNYPQADVTVYLPFDTPANARRFIEAVNPDIAIFVKYEFWRNYLHELDRRGVPTFLISAVFRPDQMFFRPAGARYSRWLQCFNTIYVQDERSRALLRGIGMTRTVVAGDTRFDRVTDVMAAARRSPAAEAFRALGGDMVVFGSSWPADEALYIPWLRRNPDVRAIIAPHEFDPRRVDRLKGVLGPGAVALSEIEATGGNVAADTRYLIVDCFGLLSSLYRLADWAYVGGGFGAGLHNINEAAVYSVPVVYGPNNAKFIEARELAECGGGFPVATSEELGATFDRLKSDTNARITAGSAAGAYIKSRLGATDRIYSDLFGDSSPYLK